MIKLLSSASVIALLAVSPVAAQTTTTPPAATQDNSQSATPSVTQEKSAAPGPQTGTQPAAQDQAAAITMTEDQAKEWVSKPVFSSDGKEIGDVAEVKRTPDNKVSELHADTGGFLGFGQTRVKLMPSEFKLQGDRVVLNLTEEQSKALPKVDK
jgi:hypothetical protein